MRGASKRDAILRAALELMSERTFDGTPMPLVADRARVGAGTIYRYFESKEALGNAVYRRCEQDLLEHLQASAAGAGDLRQEFRGLWRGLYEFARKKPEAFRFLETHHHERYLDDGSRALTEKVLGYVRDFVDRAQAVGVIRREPAALLIALAYGAFVGLSKEEAAGRLCLDEETVARAEDAVWDLLRVHDRGES